MNPIERIDAGRRMSRIVKHAGVAYLRGQVGEGGSVIQQSRDCLARVEALLARPCSAPELRVEIIVTAAC